MSNQIETQIDVTLTERNRVTAFFRIILAVPALIFVSSFAPSAAFSDEAAGIFTGLLAVPAGLAIVVRQVYPSYVLVFNEALLSLQTRVDAYLVLLTDEYPSIEENDIVSVTFPEVDAKQLNRWLPLIKCLLALPLYLVGIVYFIYATLLTLLGWFSILFTGKYPEVCAEGVVGTIAYWNRVVGYAFLLVTDEYPTFSL
jgi:hypothetical protein